MYAFTTLLFVTLISQLFGFNQLYCNNESKSYDLYEYRINAKVEPLSDFGLYPMEVCAYDDKDICHKAPHLSISSMSTYVCIFTMKDYFISSRGFIYQGEFLDGSWQAIVSKQVTFDHESISGSIATSYAPEIAKKWNKHIVTSGSRFNKSKLETTFDEYDTVVPLRMQFDGLFNHMSFQVIPMIANVFKIHHEVKRKLVYHCSNYSAAVLGLLNIPKKQIIVEKTIFAKQVLLPWIPHWIPIYSATMRGIAGKVCEGLTNSLLSRQFPDSVLKNLKPLKITSPSHPNASYTDLIDKNDPYRYIVYNSRAGQSMRDVYKEEQLLTMISSIINKSKYRLVVVYPSFTYNSIEMLQASWSRFAKIYSKAIVMIGPHGATFNNLIFTPRDCHVIEFNHFPEITRPINGTTIRTYFLAAHFAKGGRGKFYNIEANNATSSSKIYQLYVHYQMKISQRDVAKTLVQINNEEISDHDLLVDNVNLMNIPTLTEEDLNVSTLVPKFIANVWYKF